MTNRQSPIANRQSIIDDLKINRCLSPLFSSIRLVINLDDRITAIAEAARAFPWLGDVRVEKIRAWVDLELGKLLERPEPYGNQIRQAIRMTPILHVVSGNTPHAALQSLIRGLVVGSENFIKIPTAGLPELEEFAERLPLELRPRTSRSISPEWMRLAEVIIVFGSDETIRHFAAQIQPHQRFIPHGNKISFGLVLNEFDDALVERAAQDVFLFDQLGCLSPQSYFVAHRSKEFAHRVARALDRLTASSPPTPLRGPEIAAKLRVNREEWKYRAATEQNAAVWESPNSLEWTVIHSISPASTPLYRTLFVHPITEDLFDSLASIRPYLSTVGLDRMEPAGVTLALRLGAQRVCPIGAMQNPPLTWHQDGSPSLSSLVRYVDIEQQP
jgi:hypothetical protein